MLVVKTASGILFPCFMTTQSYVEYQTFSLYLSYLPILSLGFHTGMFIKYGGQPFATLDKARYKSEFFLLIRILLAFTALFIVVWLLWPNRMLLYITLCILPYCLVSAYQSLYQTWGEFGKYNISFIITSVGPFVWSLGLLLVAKRLEAAWFIYLFIGVYALMAAWICRQTVKSTRGVCKAPLLDEVNLETWKTGAAICLGSYIFVLIHALDKQIVKIVFDATDFAQYSFALSLQSMVTVFITALSQPLYHFLAKEKVPDTHYVVFMRLLLMLGALGGVAYHVCRFGVAWILPDYTGSLDIVAIYFAVFPPMAVIHCLFVNLYKLRRLRKAYVFRLGVILGLSIAMNVFFLSIRRDTLSVAVAMVIVYYLWFLADTRTFGQIGISVKDGLFLVSYLVIYVLSAGISMPVAAGLVYFMLICLLCLVIYGREVMVALKYAVKKTPADKWKGRRT